MTARPHAARTYTFLQQGSSAVRAAMIVEIFSLLLIPKFCVSRGKPFLIVLVAISRKERTQTLENACRSSILSLSLLVVATVREDCISPTFRVLDDLAVRALSTSKCVQKSANEMKGETTEKIRSPNHRKSGAVYFEFARTLASAGNSSFVVALETKKVLKRTQFFTLPFSLPSLLLRT